MNHIHNAKDFCVSKEPALAALVSTERGRLVMHVYKVLWAFILKKTGESPPLWRFLCSRSNLQRSISQRQLRCDNPIERKFFWKIAEETEKVIEPHIYWTA